MDDIKMNQRDILFHSFKLTASHHIDKTLLRAIGDHDCIWWQPK